MNKRNKIKKKGLKTILLALFMHLPRKFGN